MNFRVHLYVELSATVNVQLSSKLVYFVKNEPPPITTRPPPPTLCPSSRSSHEPHKEISPLLTLVVGEEARVEHQGVPDLATETRLGANPHE